MGRLDQYAKDILATEIAPVTRGGAVWQPPSELNLTEVRLDGSLLIRNLSVLLSLAHPWPEAALHDEIVFEAKMQGDHLDMRASERACLRRQARQVQRMEEDAKRPWDGDLPLWVVASNVPAVLRKRRRIVEIAQGCHRIETGSFQYLWIAANELPLREELLPFLIARRGRRLDELARWVESRRPFPWLQRMLGCLPVSTATFDYLLQFLKEEPEDAYMAERQKVIGQAFDNIANRARIAEARSALRDVLASRKLVLGAKDEARIDACTDLPTLHRWLRQAAVASTVSKALR
jgi:hypothetical protein